MGKTARQKAARRDARSVNLDIASVTTQNIDWTGVTEVVKEYFKIRNFGDILSSDQVKSHTERDGYPTYFDLFQISPGRRFLCQGMILRNDVVITVIRLFSRLSLFTFRRVYEAMAGPTVTH